MDPPLGSSRCLCWGTGCACVLYITTSRCRGNATDEGQCPSDASCLGCQLLEHSSIWVVRGWGLWWVLWCPYLLGTVPQSNVFRSPCFVSRVLTPSPQALPGSLELFPSLWWPYVWLLCYQAMGNVQVPPGSRRLAGCCHDPGRAGSELGLVLSSVPHL